MKIYVLAIDASRINYPVAVVFSKQNKINNNDSVLSKCCQSNDVHEKLFLAQVLFTSTSHLNNQKRR